MDAKTDLPLLDVQNLTVTFDLQAGTRITVLNDVSLSVAKGETLGVVGESGCGKSTLALAIMRLVKPPTGRIGAGQILLDGVDLVACSEKEMRQRRGVDLGMIFQEPLTSLNPVYSVGEQIAEVLRRHKNMTRAEARTRAVDILRMLKLPDPQEKLGAFPHELSGGMRQRVMIAIALACEPKLMIADEPTTALDVTVQAQIFDLLKDIRPPSSAMILITHDFGAVAEMADRVVVMYAGHCIEQGTVREIITSPVHPYTQGLLACVPDIADDTVHDRGALPEVAGTVPSLTSLPPGCPFAPRCEKAFAKCREMPPTTPLGAGRSVKCWLALEDT
jgi:peptide/nickel transport system ATP-binding protein